MVAEDSGISSGERPEVYTCMLRNVTLCISFWGQRHSIENFPKLDIETILES